MIALISHLQSVPSDCHSLILQHIPRVQAYVRSRFRTFDLEQRRDLLSVAFVGLVEAATRYDAHVNCYFWGYAKKRVQGAIADYLRQEDLLTRTQRNKVRQFFVNKNNTITTTLQNTCKNEAIPPMNYTVVPFSQLDLEGEDSFLNRLADVETPSTEELAHDFNVIRTIFAWIDDLPERERQVIDGIYRKHKSAHEMAKILSLTDGRISQLHQRGLQLLRARWLAAFSH